MGAGGGAASECNVAYCTFINNHASTYGGAMWKGEASNSSFLNNSASSYGGAVYQSTALNCNFTNNSAKCGGAMYDGSAQDCSFINNSATDGAAIGGGSSLNCKFINNFATSGGAIWKGDAIDCIFLNNSATYGGAIYDSTAFKCNFTLNNADNYGGAAYVSDVNNSLFNNNLAVDGGAMYGGSASNTNFSSNIASNCGGAVCFGSFSSYSGIIWVANLSNCILINNSAAYGGAVSSHKSEYYFNVESIKLIEISNCIFVNNSADDGGAIEISHKYRKYSITNSTFKNNTAGSGGAVYSTQQGNILNSSFTNCSSNIGGAIWSESNLNITFSNFTSCISDDGSEYLGCINASVYNITDCLFDVSPKSIKYHYSTALTVNNLYIAKGEKGFLYANLSTVAGSLKNKRINFAINGKRYYSTTDDEGIAEFNVNNYLTSLGETLIELSFTGDDIYYPSTADSIVYINKYFGNLTVNLDGEFYNDTILAFNLVNSITNVPISNASIQLNFSNNLTINLTTDFEGNAVYTIPFSPDTYDVFAYVNENHVDVNNVSVKNIVINKLIGEIEVTPLNDNHTLMIRLYNPDNLSAVYRNVKVNIEFGPNDILKDEVLTNEYGYVIYDLLNFTKGTYSISVFVRGDYKDFYDYYLADYVISNLLNSKINFTNNIDFDFGEWGSTNFTVEGAKVELENIKVINHSEAIISISNNTITVFGLSVGNYVLQVETTPDDYHNPINATCNITVNNAKSKVIFSAGIVFEYGSSSSIHVTVEGGKVESQNIAVDNHPEAKIIFKDNVITVSGLNVGTYTLRVTSTPDSDHDASEGTVGITVKKATAVLNAQKITVALKKGTAWTITLVDSKTSKPIANMNINLKVYTGKKYKTYTVKTNSKGQASFKTSGLSKGTHKVVVSASHSQYNFNTLTSSIKVIKPKKLTFKVTRKTAKDGATLSITVKYKKKPVNGVKIKLLIYTGKKYKTVTLKTKKVGKYKGVAGYGTNKLTVGKHKVKIVPAAIKYKGSKTTSMKILKSAKQSRAWTTLVSG